MSCMYKCPDCGREDDFYFTVPVQQRYRHGSTTSVGVIESTNQTRVQCVGCDYDTTQGELRTTALLTDIDFGKRQLINSDMSPYDGIEVWGCKIDLDHPESINGGLTELDNPDFWSVQLHCISGGLDTIYDFRTKPEAELAASILKQENHLLRRADEEHAAAVIRVKSGEEPYRV